MSDTYLNHVAELVEKYETYKSPTDTQKLIIILGSKERTDDENKKLKILVNAEKKVAQLAKARQAAKAVTDKEKADKRKAETRKKILWGSALLTAAKENIQIAELLVFLHEAGYIAEKDKTATSEEYNELKNKLDNRQSAH